MEFPIISVQSAFGPEIYVECEHQNISICLSLRRFGRQIVFSASVVIFLFFFMKIENLLQLDLICMDWNYRHNLATAILLLSGGVLQNLSLLLLLLELPSVK